jgi:sirohydrochlorin ferrochelatase
MDGILLIGHGSRASKANEAMYQVASDLKATTQYEIVECCFLEINQPDIGTGLTNCLEAGADRIIVIPYFLNLGNHVQQDLPRIIGDWLLAAPDVEVIMGQHFGYSPKLVELVQERISDALSTFERSGS